MPIQPPSITPRQMNLLRIATYMAWADGHLAMEEVEILLDRFSHLFASNPEQQQNLKQELREYLVQNVPLEHLVSKLETDEDRELVLKLGYEVIYSSSRTPDEPKINTEEAKAYQQLLNSLKLPAETVSRLEAEVQASRDDQGVVDTVVQKLEQFLQP